MAAPPIEADGRMHAPVLFSVDNPPVTSPVDSSFRGRFEFARQECIALGHRFIKLVDHGGSLRGKEVSDILMEMCSFIKLDAKYQLEMQEALVSLFEQKRANVDYFGAIKTFCRTQQESRDLVALYALKMLIEAVESLTVSAAGNSEADKSYGIEENIVSNIATSPNVFGLGVGQTRDGKQTRTAKIASGAETTYRYNTRIAIVVLKEFIDICIRYQTPTQVPSIPDAIGSFLTGTINEAHCRFLIEYNGGVWEEWQKVVQSNRAKLNAGEITALYMRERITSQQYFQRLRELGYLKEQDVYELRELAEQVPPFTDLIRFMVRDVEDIRLVDKFSMDADFDLKWTGESEKWGRWQGVSADLMRRYWRAHWTIPSPTQLYEMYHRLRFLPDEDNRKVTLDTIREALQQQDILPFWIPKLLEISFSPLTRVDTQRAFFIGVFGREQVKKSYLDIGYSDDNAETLTKFTERLKFLRGVNERVARLYIDGAIGEAHFRTRLTELRYSDEEVELIVQRVKRIQQDNGRIACTKALKQRFMTGEFIEGEAATQLALTGIDADSADRVARQWACERDAKAKFPRATELCDAFTKGILSDTEFRERLVRIGYSERDAEVTVSRCRIAALERREAKALAAARRATAEQEKAERRAQADTEKLRRQQEAAAKARLAAQAKRDKIERELVKAAGKLAKRLEIGIEDAMRRIHEQFARLLAGGAPSQEQLQQISPLLSTSLDATGAVTPAERERIVAADLQRMRDQPGYLPSYLSPELLQRAMEILGIGRRDRLEMAIIIADAMGRLPDGDFDLANFLDKEIVAWEEAEETLS